MKRGRILMYSVLIEIVVFGAICLLPWFLPISLFWKILIVVGGIIVMLLIAFLLIYFKWAPNNLFFTFVPEGRAKIVVKGEEFCKSLIQFKGYTFDDKWNVIPEGVWTKDGKVLTVSRDTLFEIIVKLDRKLRRLSPEKLQGVDFRKKGREVKRDEAIEPRKEPNPWFRRWFGLRLYGFWPTLDVFIYDFQWTGIKENGEFDPHPKETLDYVLLKDDIYGCRVEKAEDKNLLPLDVNLALTVRIVNPYKALFVVQNWNETVMNRVRPYVRDFITTETYERLIGNPDRIGTEIWARLDGQDILNEFRNRYGVEFRKIEVKNIDPGEDYRKATLAKYLAERERDKIVVQADAERQRLETVAIGEVSRIKRVYSEIEQRGDLGKLIRTLETLEKSPEKGAKWIIPVPGIADFFSQVFPGREVGSLGSDELRTIRKIIEQFRDRESSSKQGG